MTYNPKVPFMVRLVRKQTDGTYYFATTIVYSDSANDILKDLHMNREDKWSEIISMAHVSKWIREVR